jgi:L-amino acid N-acyltransferase YncA
MRGEAKMIRRCRAQDAAAICEIYNPYIRDTVITFEETPVEATEMARRIERVTERLPWLVWDQDGSIEGYAYAAAWRQRSAYRYSVEGTVYVAESRTGRGIGTALYRALIEDLKTRDVHSVIGAIALPNPASVALHEKLGFLPLGKFSDVGYKLGRWVDVGYWELLLPYSPNTSAPGNVSE